MKIDGPNPLRKNAPVKKKDGTGTVGSAGSEFFSLLSPQEASTASYSPPVADIAPSPSLDGLLTLQEMPDDERREREAYKHSQATVGTLEKLRDALLTGSIPSHLLGELQAVVRNQQDKVSDPRLQAIMQDIELRAAVEIAKLERAKRDA